MAGLLAQFKSDRSPGFLLPHSCAIRRVSASGDILDPDGDDIATTKLAVDRRIEHRQIIEAAKGMHLWADHFDGTLDAIFELQDKVTSRVVGAIAPSVTRAEMERAKRKPPNDLDAYDCFLRGQWAMWQNTKDRTDQAIDLYEQAVALDSQFTAAYAGVATGLNQRIHQQWSATPASDKSRAMECASHALSLKSEEHTTLARIAWVFSLLGGELERADSLFEEAVRLNPNGMDTWTWGGFNKSFLANHQSALEYFHRAI